MGKAKKLRAAKVRAVKKVLNPKDPRLKATQEKNLQLAKKKAEEEGAKNIQQVPTSMFFAHNSALGPPCVHPPPSA